MLRWVLSLGLFAAVGAVSLTHTQMGSASFRQVAASTFGQGVLEELQSKMDAGSPLTELDDILQEIKTRLVAANQSDYEQNEDFKAQCTSWLSELNRRITFQNNTIERLIGEIAAMEKKIEGTEDEIDTKEEEIEDGKKEIARLEKQYLEEETKRNESHALYLDRVNSTHICIAAVAEITNTPGFKNLTRSAHIDASTYNADYYKKDNDATAEDVLGSERLAATDLLQKAANQIPAGKVKDIMMLAITATTVMEEVGDVKELNELLWTLDNELKNYKAEIDADEASDQKAWEKLKAELEEAIRLAKVELANDEEDLRLLEERLEKEKGVLENLKLEKKTAEARRDKLMAEAATNQKTCADNEAAYQQRQEDRAAEFTTLSKIWEIISEKLKEQHDKEHLTQRLSNVTLSD